MITYTLIREICQFKGGISTPLFSLLTISYMTIIRPLLTSPLLTCLPLYYCCPHYIIYMLLRVMIYQRGGGQLVHRGKQCPLNCKNVSVRCLNLVLGDGCRNPLGLKRDNDGSSCLNYGCMYDQTSKDIGRSTVAFV